MVLDTSGVNFYALEVYLQDNISFMINQVIKDLKKSNKT